jgi:hypothetical protein
LFRLKNVLFNKSKSISAKVIIHYQNTLYKFIIVNVSATHHAFAFDANIILFSFARSAVDHRDSVPVEESLAAWHAIQFAFIRTSGVRNPTAKVNHIA